MQTVIMKSLMLGLFLLLCPLKAVTKSDAKGPSTCGITKTFTKDQFLNDEYDEGILEFFEKQLSKHGNNVIIKTEISLHIDGTPGDTHEAMTTTNTVVTTTDSNTNGDDMKTESILTDNCQSNRSGPYFWSSAQSESNVWDVTYQAAVQICANCSSVPAVIPDEDTFNEIANTIRLVFKDVGTPQLWLGVTVDQNTLKVDPPYAFVKWFSGHPRSGRSNVAVMVASSNLNTKMISYNPSKKTHGVVCWKPRSSL